MYGNTVHVCPLVDALGGCPFLIMLVVWTVRRCNNETAQKCGFRFACARSCALLLLLLLFVGVDVALPCTATYLLWSLMCVVDDRVFDDHAKRWFESSCNCMGENFFWPCLTKDETTLKNKILLSRWSQLTKQTRLETPLTFMGSRVARLFKNQLGR